MTIRVNKKSKIKSRDIVLFEDENNKTIIARAGRKYDNGDEITLDVTPFNYKRKFIIALRNPRKATQNEVDYYTENFPHWFM